MDFYRAQIVRNNLTSDIFKTLTFNSGSTISNETNFNELKNVSKNTNFDLHSTFAREYLPGLLEVQSRQAAAATSILCVLRTEEYLHKGRTQHAADTWVKHCNTALFVSDAVDKKLPSIKVAEKARWPKTLAAIKILHVNFTGLYNWTIILEDDTYVIIENLREVLSTHSSLDKLYFKFNMMTKPPVRYQNRDMGYVLSSKAVEIIATKSNNSECAKNKNLESCCLALGLTLGDLRDPDGAYRIFPYDLRTGINVSAEQEKDWWDWDHAFWPAPQAPYCCSKKPLTFHFVSPTMMYAFEFMIYYMRAVSHHPISLSWSHITSNFDNVNFNNTNTTSNSLTSKQ